MALWAHLERKGSELSLFLSFFSLVVVFCVEVSMLAMRSFSFLHHSLLFSLTAVADVGDDSVLTVDMNSVQSNIIMLRTTRSDVTPQQVCQRLMQVHTSFLLLYSAQLQQSEDSDTLVNLGFGAFP